MSKCFFELPVSALFGYQPFKPILSFSKCFVSRPNEAVRGHPAAGPRTEFVRYLDFLPGDISLYEPYRYVPPQRVWFLRFFGLLKTDIHFAHFGLEWGMVFEGITGV